ALLCKLAAAWITRQMLVVTYCDGVFERNPIMAAVLHSPFLFVLAQLAGIAVIIWAYTVLRRYCAAETDFRRHIVTVTVVGVFVFNLMDAANNLAVYL